MKTKGEGPICPRPSRLATESVPTSLAPSLKMPLPPPLPPHHPHFPGTCPPGGRPALSRGPLGLARFNHVKLTCSSKEQEKEGQSVSDLGERSASGAQGRFLPCACVRYLVDTALVRDRLTVCGMRVAP